jgi:hypothetical protein
MLQERALANARFAIDDKHSTLAASDSVEEGVQSTTFLCPTNQVARRPGHSEVEAVVDRKTLSTRHV